MEIIDLEMIRGDDESWAFEVTYEDESAVDFSGYRFDLHIKPMKKNEPIIKLSSKTGDITVESNLIKVKINHDKTENANWDNAKWDLQSIDSNQIVRTLVGGDFILLEDVTREVG
ncbi:hypothetical protein HZI61_00875 [Haemophilus influenzae]|uniref:hypothetical protein n=1 Tax=Haemophilus influenzae TaxID=727 RepID=UPI0015C5EED0|nr:hypothetical protein [Haemophilus influenzae]NXZ83745.1 hypothetical protein [Haemophilus influenzae]